MSLLLRAFKRSHRDQTRPQPSPSSGPRPLDPRPRHATADFTEADDDDDDDDFNHGRQSYYRRDDANEDGRPHPSSILPRFSSGHLDSLPVYTITHAIRIIVQARTETTLTWEQLRSPQVSQFLVKPMQQQIRAHHFSIATLYALMANCLQFSKERQLYPGNAGTSATRAKVCELLAIKLLKEYSTRELIDALSYDFYPLNGIPGSSTPIAPGIKAKQSAARTSTLEVAIRASAKHFLAHPLVVQQVEAIWSGAISFYSAADRLHRPPVTSTSAPPGPSGTWQQADQTTPLLAGQPGKEEHDPPQAPPGPGRRTASLYDPRTASLFKLSRLRVPRYRQILSTLSLAVLIGLFLAVLIDRSPRITTLELVFWFWSAGFMLDELVGFTEQGFSLYMMSFWNIFDLGILFLLIVYYFMRIYGVFVIDANRWNDRAYDILAANAILLLPRIFSVLDHYQYFSQLLIAFRLMAVDLAAVFVLVLVSCSGFFVFFTLSKNNHDGAEFAYKIFQILMGFTPAAWELWPSYDWLGRALMGLFLIICHFVIVTILITVLTNSFMSIASNASEEHQFLFAINTISEIKNDSLFSYVAPGNIFAWALMPLRYCMSLRRFVALNRMVIKITHFPVLFCIYVYEKYFLAPSMYGPTDLVEHPGGRQRAVSLADPGSRAALLNPNARVREGSIVGYQKDHALEEVFRRTPDFATLRTQRRNERRKTQNAIRTWMDQHDGEYTNSPPRNYSTVDSRGAQDDDWQRRHSVNRGTRLSRFRHFSDARSAASDPADLMSNVAFPASFDLYNDGISRRDHAVEVKDHTDADGDDELITNDEEEEDNTTNIADTHRTGHSSGDEDEDVAFMTPMASRFGTLASSLESSSRAAQKSSASLRARPSRHEALHNRTLSSNTILYAPQEPTADRSPSSSPLDPASVTLSRPVHARNTPPVNASPAGGSDRRSPRRSLYMTPHVPSGFASREAPRATLNRSALLGIEMPTRPGGPRRVSSVDQDPSSELNAALAADDALGAMPSSFATQMAMAMNPMGVMGKGIGGDRDSSNRMSRLMLAKMKTLEESLGDVVREMRVLRGSGVPSTAPNSGDDDSRRGFPGRQQKQYKVGSNSTSGSAGPVLIEVASREHRGGLTRSKTVSGRLGRAARTNAPKEGEKQSAGAAGGQARGKQESKGKGKAVETVVEAEDDGYGGDYGGVDDEALADEAEASFSKKGSSV
ncbi:hypothetical protein VTK73DRAFT_3512 [Phialemonium thermophilum]|uniref:Ion transport domain-containing protein n=1 Tax=Phialemonium thermophilum TaxID=223376 RepID=A0ABR3WZ28_9PEZI